MPLRIPKWHAVSDCIAALTAAEVALAHPEVSCELAEAHAEDITNELVQEAFGGFDKAPNVPNDEEMITLLEAVSRRVVRAIRKHTLKDIE